MVIVSHVADRHEQAMMIVQMIEMAVEAVAAVVHDTARSKAAVTAKAASTTVVELASAHILICEDSYLHPHTPPSPS